MPFVVGEPRWVSDPETSYELDANSLGREWTRFRGWGGGDRAFEAKFQVAAGSPQLVGLRLDDGQPITARQLRELRLAKLESLFGRCVALKGDELESVEAHLEEMWAGADSLTHEERGDLAVTSGLLDDLRADLNEWIDRLGVTEDVVATRRGRGASPPSNVELRRFARTYLMQRQQGQYGAVVRTAEEIGMHRSTVYRWLRTCEEMGLVPPGSSEAGS